MIPGVPPLTDNSGLIDVACNLCQRRDVRERFVSPAWKQGVMRAGSFRPADDVYGDFGRIVECRSCGLVYTNPRLPAGPLVDAYQGVQDDSYQSEDASRSINGHFNLNTIRQYVRSGTLLDVGCSTGYLLNAARLHFDVMGIEPSRWATDFAEKQLKLRIVGKTLADAQVADHSVDVVTLVDVIEHLDDPLATLKEIHRVLKPGGLLYMVTPDIASFAARILRSRWWGLRPAHIYYFSPRTLSRLLETAGFETLLMGSYGRVFALEYWLSRLRHYGPWVNGLLRWGVDRWGIGRKLVYLNTLDSIECAARARP